MTHGRLASRFDVRQLTRVAVVVPCRNEAETLGRVLQSLAGQTRPPDETVVVDDGSTDDTARVAADAATQHPALCVRQVGGPGRGPGPAMNVGIGATDADIIVRLDGHCRPSPNYIALSLQTLEAPDVGVAGGVWRIEPGARTWVARGIAAVLSHPLGAGGAAYRQAEGGPPRAVDTVPFGTFRRELWDRLGGYDESLFCNEDYDFNHRVRMAGLHVLLNPEIVSVYKARPTLSALARQYFSYGFWKVAMLRKFPASLRLRQFLPIMLLPVLVALVVWGIAGRAWLPVALAGVYVVLNLLGALHAALRARDARLAPAAAVGLVILQTAWSAGAWASLLRGTRARDQ